MTKCTCLLRCGPHHVLNRRKFAQPSGMDDSIHLQKIGWGLGGKAEATVKGISNKIISMVIRWKIQ